MRDVWIAVVVLAVVSGAYFMAGCSQGTDGTSEQAAQSGPAASQAGGGSGQSGGGQEVTQQVCPVMGGDINKDLYVEYEGRRIYFCCKGCPEKFRENPEKYVKKLDSQQS